MLGPLDPAGKQKAPMQSFPLSAHAASQIDRAGGRGIARNLQFRGERHKLGLRRSRDPREAFILRAILSGRVIRLFAVALCLSATGLRGETLQLPANLTDLSSEEGEKFFLESSALEAYFPIAANFVTQKTQAYCGVASIVMVLNALRAPAPSTPEYEPYHTFTQDNLLSEQSDAILPRDTLARQGMTLDQLGGLLGGHSAAIEVRHAADGGLDTFRADARDYLSRKDHFVIVNYLRKALGQEIGGHISPLAAYDEKADRFLILDVARYKYPPVWVRTSDLFDAMNTPDAANDGKKRGYVLIARAGEAPPPQAK
jgi:Phytochelatin synthase